MARITHVLMIVVAAAVAMAAPASASEEDFVQSMKTRYAFLSEQQLRSEGAKVCDAVRGGMVGSDATMMVRNDLGVSVSAAANIVSTAIVQLGC